MSGNVGVLKTSQLVDNRWEKKSVILISKIKKDTRGEDLERLVEKYGRIERSEVIGEVGLVEFYDKSDAEFVVKAYEKKLLELGKFEGVCIEMLISSDEDEAPKKKIEVDEKPKRKKMVCWGKEKCLMKVVDVEEVEVLCVTPFCD